MPKRYTAEEVSEIYSVQVATVWKWIRDGVLPAIKIHEGYKDRYRIRVEDLEAFEASRLTKRI